LRGKLRFQFGHAGGEGGGRGLGPTCASSRSLRAFRLSLGRLGAGNHRLE
jgi:hypothetical protein